MKVRINPANGPTSYSLMGYSFRQDKEYDVFDPEVIDELRKITGFIITETSEEAEEQVPLDPNQDLVSQQEQESESEDQGGNEEPFVANTQPVTNVDEE